MSVLAFARRSLQVLLCGLAAHAAAYGTLSPGEPIHGYMRAYESVVAALSVAALGVFALALVSLFAGRGRRLFALVGLRSGGPSAASVVTLAVAALGVLIIQESFERSVETGAIAVAGMPAVTWLNAAAAIAIVATVLVLLELSCRELVRALALLVDRIALPRAPARVSTPRNAPRLRRRNSLAAFRGLRAPPAVVC